MTEADKLKEIREFPDRHRHAFADLQACCMVGEAISLQLLDAHEGIIGRGKCDVTGGPCSCGAFH